MKKSIFIKAQLYLFGLILISSCSLSDDSVVSHEEISDIDIKQGTTFSGKEIFEGVFFLKGTTGSKIYGFEDNYIQNNLTERQLKAYKELNTFIVEYLQLKHPLFFDEFKRAMVSNNHVVIKNQLNRSAGLINEALDYLKEAHYKVIDRQIVLEKRFDSIDLDKISSFEQQKNPWTLDPILVPLPGPTEIYVAVTIDLIVLPAWPVIGFDPNDKFITNLKSQDDLINAIVQFF